ncbi:Uncharacterised protein [Mycobacteroides abscessus subsp. abscessus]|nr:Uncharacterised protein [Mycobacteroides abscessus subsp. abscessus]
MSVAGLLRGSLPPAGISVSSQSVDDTRDREQAHQSVTSRLRADGRQNPGVYADMFANALAQSWANKSSQ